ncbi:TPA: amino acid permease, partial [Klebsiella pneumoniae]
MGLLALTMMTASNMMGSGVFMLPATLARIGSISVWGWGLAFLAIAALALIFCKMSELFPRNGGIIASITASFGPFIGLQMTLFYWLSTWIGN